MLTFAQQEQVEYATEQEATVMLLCQGLSDDRKPWWAYLCIMPRYARAFRDACEKGSVNLADYGTVLESGLGEVPSDEIKLRMEQQYGMNHRFEEELLQMLLSNAH